MGAKIYNTIMIESPEDLNDILEGGRKIGLFGSLKIDVIVRLSRGATFPLQIPIEVELSQLLDILDRPVARPIVKKLIGSKMDERVGVSLLEAFSSRAGA